MRGVFRYLRRNPSLTVGTVTGTVDLTEVDVAEVNRDLVAVA